MSNNNIDAEVSNFLKTHDDFELLESGKIRSKTTKHEMPARLDVIEQYANSAKYKKALEWYQHDFNQYQPWIIPHKRHPKRLFCTLTRRDINKIPAEVQAHVNGKKYKLALEKVLAKKERQANKQRTKDGSDEEEDEDAEFWMPEDDSEEDGPQNDNFKEREEEVDEPEEENEEDDDEEEEELNQEEQSEEEEEEEEEEEKPLPKKQKNETQNNNKRKQPAQPQKKGPQAKLLQKLKKKKM
mmetsp:Transcript_5423/g.7621  ORF Transcript_5423/g.7621 Transcript_5423/m.7621 type:complete len:241 (-) Transcript_5423:45-767(-)